MPPPAHALPATTTVGFRGRAEVLDLATTDESYRRIVDALRPPVQEGLVRKPERGNHLVLAGPGSGKTRVIVHRIAWLLRVLRVPSAHIIALAFNRHAALELRRRLLALVGDDVRGVTVLTYHAMALRLTGTSLAGAERQGPVDFEQLLQDAIDLLGRASQAFTDADGRLNLLRWLRGQQSRQPANPFWAALHVAVDEMAQASAATQVPPAEVVEWIFECSAEAAALPDGTCFNAVVTGIMARSRVQTAPAYQDALKVDRWEVVLVEITGEAQG
jgi:Superfamily I DNA and RNA helicases